MRCGLHLLYYHEVTGRGLQVFFRILYGGQGRCAKWDAELAVSNFNILIRNVQAMQLPYSAWYVVLHRTLTVLKLVDVKACVAPMVVVLGAPQALLVMSITQHSWPSTKRVWVADCLQSLKLASDRQASNK